MSLQIWILIHNIQNSINGTPWQWFREGAQAVAYRIQEDSPYWNCLKMGNRICGRG
jgi:hypothetical protein